VQVGSARYQVTGRTRRIAPFARYPSIRFTREENPPDDEELFLDEISEEYFQNQTSLSYRREKISFIPPLAEGDLNSARGERPRKAVCGKTACTV
jgi:hypothetical protein